MAVSAATVLAHRLNRQGFSRLLTNPKAYPSLFERLQPVSPVHFSYPGSPPGLVHRTAFDHHSVADRLRENRTLVKGRFLGGSIGYVLAKDLGTYAAAFRRPIARLNDNQDIVLNIVRELGPLTPRQIKAETRLWEESGLLNKEIMPALHRLQEAFLVYEDQTDDDWERDWYDFAAEWPEVHLDDIAWEDAAARVLRRFLHSHVFATLEQIKDWSRFPLKTLKPLLNQMEADGILAAAEIDSLGSGWMCAPDADLPPAASEPSILMLHRADTLAKSHATELKRRFGGHKVLQYLLIDGAFQGAVLGHWRIGPHDVDDILVERPAAERKTRRNAILSAVAGAYHPPRHHIRNYDGKPVKS